MKILLAQEQSVKLNSQYGFAGPKLQNLGDLTSIVITPLFTVSTIIVFIYFLYGAVKYMLSGGNKEEIAKGRAMIINGLVGFLILIFIFIAVQFIPDFFGLKGYKII